MNEKKLEKKSKIFENENKDLEGKRYPKKRKQNFEKPKLILPYCSGCRLNSWIEFVGG